MNYLLTIASPYDPSMTCTGLIWGELTLDKIEKMANALHNQLAPHYQAKDVKQYAMQIVPHTFD